MTVQLPQLKDFHPLAVQEDGSQRGAPATKSIAAECLLQPDGHLGADGGLAVDEVVQGLTRDAKRGGRVLHGEAERIEAGVPAIRFVRGERVFSSAL